MNFYSFIRRDIYLLIFLMAIRKLNLFSCAQLMCSLLLPLWPLWPHKSRKMSLKSWFSNLSSASFNYLLTVSLLYTDLFFPHPLPDSCVFSTRIFFSQVQKPCSIFCSFSSFSKHCFFLEDNLLPCFCFNIFVHDEEKQKWNHTLYFNL